jgi:serine/threonine protein kinase
MKTLKRRGKSKTRRVKRGRKKRGGTIIGYGLDAQVYYPAIPCADGRNMRHKISKVIRSDRRATYKPPNPAIINILRQVDPAQSYFFYPEECALGELLPQNIADGLTEEDKKYTQTQTSGRMILRLHIRMNGPLNLAQLRHLDAAIKILHGNGIIHNDLYDRNIIMGGDNLPRIIDFDRAILGATPELIQIENDFIAKIAPSFYPKDAAGTNLLDQLHGLLDAAIRARR